MTSASSSTARNVVLATFATQAVVTISNSTLPTIAPKLAEVMAIVFHEPALRWISFAGLLFAAMQRALATFVVIYLVAERGYTLIEAGVMLSVLHAGGIAGRLAWGWIADHYSSTAVLLAVAAISIACTFALMALEADWPRAAVYAPL